MELIFVDKNKDEVKETCQCRPNYIEKYLKINDFTYEKIEDSDTLNDGQIYFGCAVNRSRLSSADGYIICIPGQGKFYYELFDMVKLEKFECLSSTEHFRFKHLNMNTCFFALYSTTSDKLCEVKGTLDEMPTFQNIVNRFDQLPTDSCYRLVFNSNDTENEAYFRRKLTETTFSSLELKQFSINDYDFKFFFSKPLGVDDLFTFSENQMQLIFMPELTIIKIEENPIMADQDEFFKAMVSDFKLAERIFVPFYKYVQAAASISNSKILARSFHLSQSSGTGKTKLCLHLLKELNTGIYCVSRPKNSFGFPRSISWTENLISEFKKTKTDADAIKLCLAFICASLQTFTSYGDENPIVLYSDHDNASFMAFVESFMTNFNNSRNISETLLISKISSLSSKFSSRKFFPIILDECQEFLCYPDDGVNSTRLSLYRAFRRAMISIKKTKIVAICLGTKSSLNDFVLNYRIDASARPGNEIKIISPYIFVNSFDVFFTGEIELIHANLIEKKINGFLSPETLKEVAIDCGRPLWKIYADYRSAFNAAVLKFAADTKIARLGAFVLRTGAPIVPSCDLAHKLVLSGMALLQYVDVFGESCEVCYCPEPLLSSAARVYAGSLDNLRLAIKELLEYVDKRSVLDLGSAGEFVARIVILRVMDRLAEVPSNSSKAGGNFVRAINTEWLASIEKGINNGLPEDTQAFSDYAMFTLREFLTALGKLTKTELRDLKLSEEMLDGLVNMSQFVTVKRPYNCDQLDLLHGFLRGIGYCLPTNWPGANLMIPVFRSDNRFSCVMVQVKNLDQLSIPGADTELSKEIINKMTRDYIKLNLSAKGDFDTVPDNEFAKVVIQFAEPRTAKAEEIPKCLKKIVPSAANGKDGVLWILGLDGLKHLFTLPGHRNPDSVIINDLGTILSGSRDFINRITSRDIVVLQSSQNEREGIRTLLNTSVPILTSDYLSLHDPIYQKYYPKNFKGIKDQILAHNLSSKVNNLHIKCLDKSKLKNMITVSKETMSTKVTKPKSNQKRSSSGFNVQSIASSKKSKNSKVQTNNNIIIE